MYINILFIILLLAVVIMIARQERLTKALKGFVIIMLLFTIVIAALFEYSSTKSYEKSRPIINAFKENKNIICNNHVINLNTYSYEPGTSSFQPRINIVGETFALQECALK